jgi:hypothetical protein
MQLSQLFRLRASFVSRSERGLLNVYHAAICDTVEPLLSGLMTGCRWPDNKKSRIIEDDSKTTRYCSRTCMLKSSDGSLATVLYLF